MMIAVAFALLNPSLFYEIWACKQNSAQINNIISFSILIFATLENRPTAGYTYSKVNINIIASYYHHIIILYRSKSQCNVQTMVSCIASNISLKTRNHKKHAYQNKENI